MAKKSIQSRGAATQNTQRDKRPRLISPRQWTQPQDLVAPTSTQPPAQQAASPSGAAVSADTIEQEAQRILASGQLDHATRPSLLFRATPSDESRRVFNALTESRSFFAVEPAPLDDAPTVIWAGEAFIGLREITALIETLAKIDADVRNTLRNGGATGLGKPQPALARAMEYALTRNHQQAREALSRLATRSHL